MKRLLLIFTWLWLMSPLFAEAQQIRVLSERLQFSGKMGSSQRKSIILHNESAQIKTFLLKNLNGNIGSSQKVKICLGDQCFDSKKELAKIKLVLAPSQIMTDLYVEFEMGIVGTMGSFDLIFVNSDNIRETFVVEALYDVTNPAVKTDGVEFEDITLTGVYPNPSSRVAHLDYQIKNPRVKAKIAINSFIGNPVAEYILDPDRTTLSINVSDFKEGIYFYTLFLDNKNIVTRKLQIKK
jgi:hypothetical protein